jgi:signal transduction histidine kinase
MELHLADEGPGIAIEARERLFEPFFTTKHRGTGLGLATARRVIEAHGGTIDLASPVTGGTVATIVLPAAAAPVAVSVGA